VIISVLVAFARTMPGAKRGRPIFCTGKERSDGCDAECDAGLAFLAIACPTCSAEHESMAR
jgi:hypothetical protein